MNRKLKHHHIAVRKSNTHGFGVFAEKKITKGQLIEECYMIISRGGDKTLEDFYFDLNGKYATLTGYGSIYNHSDDENADYKFNRKRRIATITAARTIQKGEEIFVSYGDEWFSSRGLKSKENASNQPKKMKR